MTYGSVNHRQTLLRGQVLAHDDCYCSGTCDDCTAEDASTFADLAAYTASRRRLLVKSLDANTVEYKRIKPGTPEANTECIELLKQWNLTKEAIAKARGRLKKAADRVEKTRREFSREMDQDIDAGFRSAIIDLAGAALSKSPSGALAAIRDFAMWRRRFNHELPGRIDRALQPALGEYQAAAELVRDELKNEQKITRSMSRLRCANFR